MLRFKPAIQFVEQYHSVVSCALNMEDRILNNYFVNSVIKKFLTCSNAYLTNQLTDFRAILYMAIGNQKFIDIK
jgi:hypothetical protein